MTIKEGYLRVTEILAPFSGLHLIPTHILDNAKERGNKVDEHCKALMTNGITFSVEDAVIKYIHSFESWAKNKKFIERPPRLYCDKYQFCGEIDGIYEDKGDLVLIDVKATRKEGSTWIMQASGYYYLLKEHGFDIKRIEFIQVKEDGSFPNVYVYKPNFKKFLRYRWTYLECFQNWEAKRNELIESII